MKQLFSDSALWGYLIVFFLVLLIPIGFLLFILFRNKKYMSYFLLSSVIPILVGAIASMLYYFSGDARLQNSALSPLYFGLAMSIPIIIEALAGILLTSNKKGKS
jgi:hypothetical protein